MRGLAAKWGFRYLGPPAPKWWWGRSSRIGRPPISTGLRISRVWNVVEGEKDGIPVLIFDVILGEGRSSQPCTLVAFHTRTGSLATSTSDIRVIEKGEWTVLYGGWLLWFCWTMSVKRLDTLISELEKR
jgi:hypothetical protein